MEERNCYWCNIGYEGPKQVGKDQCVFCHFDDPEVIVYEDETFLAVLSTAPLNKHQVVIVPKEHYIDMSEVPDDVLSRMYILAKRIGEAIKKATKADGITYIHDDGITNLIEHFTLHVFPRYKNDKICGHYLREDDLGVEARRKYTEEIRQFL